MKKGSFLKHLKRISIIFVLLIVFIAGCDEEVKGPDKNLAKLYVDLQVSQELYSYNQDTLKVKQDSIFAHYNTNMEKYRERIEAIPFNSAAWDTFFSYAQHYIDSLKTVNPD